MASGNEVLMLTSSDVRIDPRIEREARALAEHGYRVTIICPVYTLKKAPSPNWGEGVEFRWLPMSANNYLLKFPFYKAIEFYRAARQRAPLVVHAHDLSMCYAALAAARETGAHFVADFHEWYSENVTWSEKENAYRPHSKRTRKAFRKLEKSTIMNASAVVTVCDSIASELEKELCRNGQKIHVVRNIPILHQLGSREYPSLRKELNVSKEKFILLYQGGLGPSRMLEPVVEALTHAPKCVLVIRGPRAELYGPSYTNLAKRNGVSDRLFLLPPVPSGDVVAAANGADAGIWTLPNISKNFYYALPNKIFEYVAAGLPILTANYPEAQHVVDEFGVGNTFDPYDPKSIGQAINDLIDDPERAHEMRQATQVMLSKIDAVNEWQKLVKIYDALPRTPERES